MKKQTIILDSIMSTLNAIRDRANSLYVDEYETLRRVLVEDEKRTEEGGHYLLTHWREKVEEAFDIIEELHRKHRGE